MPRTARADAPVVLEAEDVRVWFPIRRGAAATDGRSRQGGRRREPDRARGPDGGRGGRERLRQDHARPGAAAPAAVRGPDPLCRATSCRGSPPGALRPLRREMQVVFQDPYGALSPRMSIAQIVGEGLGVHGIGATPAERRALIDAALREVGLDPGAPRPLPPRVLRRPAPAHRHRPGPGPEAALRGARRADLRAGHVGAGAGRRPSARAAGAPSPRLPLHQPRPQGHPRDERRDPSHARRAAWSSRGRPSGSSSSRPRRTRAR